MVAEPHLNTRVRNVFDAFRTASSHRLRWSEAMGWYRTRLSMTDVVPAESNCAQNLSRFMQKYCIWIEHGLYELKPEFC